MQDKHFWNSTLRVYPEEDGIQPKSRVLMMEDSPNNGLVTLDLSRNTLGNKGAMQLCEVMAQNQWILGRHMLQPDPFYPNTNTISTACYHRTESERKSHRRTGSAHPDPRAHLSRGARVRFD
jgi:hypothetical protein